MMQSQWRSAGGYFVIIIVRRIVRKREKPDNAHIVIIPTPFFKLLTLSSTIMHGAHYSIEISSSIIGKYARNLYYILESRKNIEHIPMQYREFLHLHWKNFKTYLHILVRIEQQMSEDVYWMRQKRR